MPEIVGFIAGIVILVFLFKPIFGDASGFLECVRFWFTPDIFSLVRGEWGDDWWAELKLGFWLLCGGAVGFAVYSGMVKLLSQLYSDPPMNRDPTLSILVPVSPH